MKKIGLIVFMVILLCGCNDHEENSLVKKNYISQNNYDQIYSDLQSISNDIKYIPTKELEKNFYELIEVISDNCERFSQSELDGFYTLIDNGYRFKYSGDRYDNDDKLDDLEDIKTCLTE